MMGEVHQWGLSTYEGKLLISLVLLSTLAVGLYRTDPSITSAQGDSGGVRTAISSNQSSIPPSVYHFETVEPLQPIVIQSTPSYTAPASTSTTSTYTSAPATTSNSKSTTTSSTSTHSNKLTDFLKKLF